GLSDRSLKGYLDRLTPHLDALRADYASGALPLLRIAQDRDDLTAARAALDKLSDGARMIVFFGTGGSSLGGQTLAQLAGWSIPGGADSAQRTRPRTRFYDNLDPFTLAGGLGTLDLARTRFIVTSKSGGTAETLAQVIVALSAVKDAGLEDQIPNLFLGI